MSMNDLEQAIQLLEAGAIEADFIGPQPEYRIRLAEKILGLSLPPTYRQFLQRLGLGGIGGVEFFGLIQDDFENSGIPDAIWLTLKRRREWAAPHAYIFVSETGDGGDYVIDTSQVNIDGDSPVLECWAATEAAENGMFVAEDFGAFLLGKAQGVL